MSPEGEPATAVKNLVKGLPSPPRSQRTSRFQGEDRAVALSELPEADRDRVRAVYAALSELDRRMRAGVDVREALVAFDVERVLQLARSLGHAEREPSEPVRHALHDVRGGALSSLTLMASRQLSRPDSNGARALRILAADHLKVMRNALLELDDERRAADRAHRVHLVDRLAATLERVASDRAQVHVECSFRGGVTTSCMELGALDRAALNVANNAVRHAASDTVDVWLAPIDGQTPSDLRIVVANMVEQAQARTLDSHFGGDLSRLFLEHFSTTGSGDGLNICAEFVSAAYGLPRLDDSTRLGLVGARIAGDRFVAWLHWPAVA
jgi:signal transduction histidine kinase